jgi:hypothetical protein
VGQVHPEELSGPGSRHEGAGQALVLKHGVQPEVAKCCVSHAAWRRQRRRAASSKPNLTRAPVKRRHLQPILRRGHFCSGSFATTRPACTTAKLRTRTSVAGHLAAAVLLQRAFGEGADSRAEASKRAAHCCWPVWGRVHPRRSISGPGGRSRHNWSRLLNIGVNWRICSKRILRTGDRSAPANQPLSRTKRHNGILQSLHAGEP